ncbi:F-box protein [Ideonella azotifigens]|uniref:F-box domain-containing protein n=1 Tax=Ideonella azotifigens TaxID=513160 RepID=A0ABN1K589_9BURK|nr:F-box protein [Ideonella azotifigens]MCD2344362.1 F-box protein [Ideonella azotifigens]
MADFGDDRPDPFQNLPNEVLFQIFGYLNPQDYLRASRVSQATRGFAVANLPNAINAFANDLAGLKDAGRNWLLSTAELMHANNANVLQIDACLETGRSLISRLGGYRDATAAPLVAGMRTLCQLLETAKQGVVARSDA